MENPTKGGHYTTVFRDGSIIHENVWMTFEDGSGKWYWNEVDRGGIVNWFPVPNGGYRFHSWYKIPDWQLKELIVDQMRLEALEDGGVLYWEDYNNAIDSYCSHYYADSIEELAENEMNDGYYAGYKLYK